MKCNEENGNPSGVHTKNNTVDLLNILKIKQCFLFLLFRLVNSQN